MFTFLVVVLSVGKTPRGEVVAGRQDCLLSGDQFKWLISQTIRPLVWSGLAGSALIGFLGAICNVKCVLADFTQIS